MSVCVGKDRCVSVSVGVGVGVGVEDSSLVGKRKCCLVKAVVGQGDRQQQYYS